MRYWNNSYSVPVAWAGKTLLVKETEDRRILLCDAAGEVVAEHRLLQGHHQWSVNPTHYAGLPAAVSRPPRVHPAFQDFVDLKVAFSHNAQIVQLSSVFSIMSLSLYPFSPR